MTSMHIPRIICASRIDRRSALARRSPSARRFELERLEARTALSSGLQAGLVALDSYRAKVAPALIGSVQAASTAQQVRVAVPATFHSADPAPEVRRTGMLDAPGIVRFTETPLTGESSPPVNSEYAKLFPRVPDLLTGLAGTITILGQAYRVGVPISVLVDSAASAIGSTPADIPPELIPLGVAAASTAQQAGVALPATVASLEGLAGGTQVEEWISAAVGRIEALAAEDGSTPPNRASIDARLAAVPAIVPGNGLVYVKAQESWGDPGSAGADPNVPPVPHILFSLGKFFLNNIDMIYSNYIASFDITSGLKAFRPDGIQSVSESTAAPVQEAQGIGWTGAGWMSNRPDGIAPSGLASSFEGAAAAVQEAQGIGWTGAGWMSNVMAGGRGPTLFQGPAFQGGAEQSPDSSPVEPAPPASITAGEIPLDILLSDPEPSTQNVSISLQQVAELIPIEDSSLALVATLWTMTSDSRAEAADADEPSGERAEPVSSLASPPPWAVFVIGLDEAIERSRESCGTTLSDGGRPSEDDGAGDAAGDRLEWSCPIIPTAEEWRRPGRAEEPPGIGLPATFRAAPSPGADSNRPLPSRWSGDEALLARSSPEDGSPHDAVGGQTLTDGALRSVWAASASALFAGWLWARRERWKHGGIDRTDHRRGGRDHSEEEGR
jgi:hypothetical protein